MGDKGAVLGLEVAEVFAGVGVIEDGVEKSFDGYSRGHVFVFYYNARRSNN